MACLRLATNHWSKTKTGEIERQTIWHNINLFNERQIENIREYLTTGSHIMIEGSLTYRSYTARNGEKHLMAKINENNIIDLDR